MSGIQGKNTKPEILVRKWLHARGFRYRLHARDIPGKPDIVFPGYHALVVVHGCFWHGHDCRYFKKPKSNSEFWEQKIAATRDRDIRDREAQKAGGWRILIVWECAVRRALREKEFDVATLVAEWLRSDSRGGVINESGALFE